MNYMLHLTTIDTGTWLLLQEIFTTEIIKNNFALAGGTSLALQIGHRKSIDLDIFSTQPFDVKELEIILTSQSNFSFDYTGNNSRMLFGSINNIKCDFVHEPPNLLEPCRRCKLFQREGHSCYEIAHHLRKGKKERFF